MSAINPVPALASAEATGQQMTAKEQATIAIPVEFRGGLEILFSNQKQHRINLPASDEDGKAANLGFLVRFLCDQVMKDKRKDMFVVDETVRPGIIVMVNDTDWELEGCEQYEIKAGDEILFISTLHGG